MNKFSEETRRKMRENHWTKRGFPHPMKGKKHKTETKDKIRVKSIERLRGHPERNPRWNGGKVKDIEGYIHILRHGHPSANCRGYIREHRLVMEEHLGRYLKPTEVVHHINGIVDDNRIENLQLFDNNIEHTKFHEGKRDKLGKFIKGGKINVR